MILGIESSCDESAISILNRKGEVKGEWIHSQIAKHAEYGGVVPDLAVREHLKNFFPLLDLARKEFALPECISSIAVTCGPGLAGCLGVGISIAKTLSLRWKIPLLGINHLRGHAFSPFMPLGNIKEIKWSELLPHLGLLVSGAIHCCSVWEKIVRFKCLQKPLMMLLANVWTKVRNFLESHTQGLSKWKNMHLRATVRPLTFPDPFQKEIIFVSVFQD